MKTDEKRTGAGAPGDSGASRAREGVPAAGPHAKPELTDKEKTPKSGVLPEAEENQVDAPTG